PLPCPAVTSGPLPRGMAAPGRPVTSCVLLAAAIGDGGADAAGPPAGPTMLRVDSILRRPPPAVNPQHYHSRRPASRMLVDDGESRRGHAQAKGGPWLGRAAERRDPRQRPEPQPAQRALRGGPGPAVPVHAGGTPVEPGSGREGLPRPGVEPDG